jgi:hypothetical protein
MQNNFDLKKFLIENKLTPSSQKLNELKYSVKPSKKGFSVVKTSTGDEITSFDTEEKAKQHAEKLNKMKFIPKEKFNEITVKGKKVKTYKQNGDKSYSVTFEDDTKDTIYVSHDDWDTLNNDDKKKI